MKRLIYKKLSAKCLKVNALRSEGATIEGIAKIIGAKSLRTVSQYLEQYEEALFEQAVTWEYLCNKLKKLDDNNYTARLIFDRFYK